MRKFLIFLFLSVLPFMVFGQFTVSSDYSFDYGKDAAVVGIDAVVLFEVLNDSSSILIFENGSDSFDFEWHYHDGISDSLIISSVNSDTITYLDSLVEGLYELRALDDTFFYYVVDFAEYQPTLDSVWIEDEGDSCNTIRLFASVDRQDISVYDVNDSTYTLSTPKTTYQWSQGDPEKSPYENDAPYSDTSYYCSPYSDDFFSSNDYEVKYPFPDTLETDRYTAIAVEITNLDVSIPEASDNGNALKSSSTSEASGPVYVTYEVETLGSVDLASWWVWAVEDDQPNAPTYHSYQQTIRHEFSEYRGESGYRVKVEVNNDYCSASDSADIVIYESDLQVPNILILGYGYNGQFKVAHTSIDPSTFKASVYDRWGRLVHKWNDLENGWDGRSPVTNSYVSPGPYYYNIRAVGTDGKKYELIGDLNVIREKGAK